MSDSRRANYALLDFGVHLGPDADDLDVDWAEFVGDRTTERSFEVSTDDATDSYVTLQAYDVGDYGHDILVNGEPLTGFDIPPSSGWQYWMDPLTGSGLVAGENTIRVSRNTDVRDNFVVGSVTVHWKAPE